MGIWAAAIPALIGAGANLLGSKSASKDRTTRTDQTTTRTPGLGTEPYLDFILQQALGNYLFDQPDFGPSLGGAQSAVDALLGLPTSRTGIDAFGGGGGMGMGGGMGGGMGMRTGPSMPQQSMFPQQQQPIYGIGALMQLLPQLFGLQQGGQGLMRPNPALTMPFTLDGEQ